MSEKKLMCAVVLAFTCVTIFYALNFSDHSLSTKTSDWGAFGSYVGGILSPIFAVGSLFYVVKTFRQQSFETTFNILLEQHNNLARALSESSQVESLSQIGYTLKYLGNDWLSQDIKNRRSINQNYDVHRYVRVVYQILKFIDENNPSEDNKYSRIFRSFISNDLCLLIAINCSQLNTEKKVMYPEYKCLIEKYELLEHLIIPANERIIYIDGKLKLTNVLVIAGTFSPLAFGDGININKFLVALAQGWTSVFSLGYEKPEKFNLLRLELKKFEKATPLSEAFSQFIKEFDQTSELNVNNTNLN